MTRHHFWAVPLALLLLSGLLWIVWLTVDPRPDGGSDLSYWNPSSRGEELTSGSLDLSPRLHAALRIVALISLGGSLATALAVRRRSRWLGATAVFALTATVYGLSAGFVIQGQSGAPHFVYLADAFLHGQTAFEARPPDYDDNWTFYEGAWSVSFPPAPAVLMLPFVAIWGKGLNDVLFTLLLGALNVAIFYELVPLVAKRVVGKDAMDFAYRVGLTLAFGFGTVHWWLSVNGQVWFTAQIVATTFVLLALCETLGRGRPAWAAAWLGIAALARPPVLFALPALTWLLKRERSWRDLAWGVLPLAGIGLLMGMYNFARYGDPLELGYRYMLLEEVLAQRVAEHGSFSFVYLSENLYNAFLKLPAWQASWPFVVEDGWGMSILVSTPLLAYAALAPWRHTVSRAMTAAALLVALPNLFYYNTGYLQTGYRYALDFLPFLFVLVALGLRGHLRRPAAILVGLSALMGFLMLVNYLRLPW